MLNVRTRKVIRDLSTNKTRTVLVILAIAVGVFAVSTLTRVRTILDRDLTQSYLATNPTSVRISVSYLDDDLIKAIERIEGVEKAEGRQVIWARIRSGTQPWRTLKLTAITNFDTVTINQIRPHTGAWPPPDRSISLERSAISALGVNEGDTVSIETFNGQERLLTLSGTVHDLNSFPTNLAEIVFFGYVSPDTMSWFGVPNTYNEVLITVTEPKSDLIHIRNISQQVETHLEKTGVSVLGTNIPTPGQHQFYTVVNSMFLILNALAWFALFMSALLVTNTISALLGQQLQQIGVLKTIGASKQDIFAIYFSIVLVLSALALFTSLPLGLLASRFISMFIAFLLNFDIYSFEVPTRVILIELGAGLLAPTIAASYPIMKGVYITIREAINQNQVNLFGQGLIDRRLKNLPGLSTASRYALRNIFRRKVRLVLTLITLSIGGAVFMAVLNVRTSLLVLLETDISAYWQQDVTLSFQQPYRIEQVVSEALQVPGVAYVEGWLTRYGFPVSTSANHNQERIAIFAAPPNSRFMKPTLLEGRWLTEDDTNALVINVDVVAQRPDLSLGSMLELEIEGRTESWQVVGIVTSQIIGFEEPKLELPIAYANYDYFAKEARQTGKADRLVIEISPKTVAFQSQVSNLLENHFIYRGIQVRSVETRSLIYDLAQALIGLLTVFLVLMAVLFAAVGILSLASTMSLNVLERTREIGVLRAIGGDDALINRVIIYEGIFVGLFSWFLATLIAIPLSVFLNYTIGLAFIKNPLTYNLAIGGIFMWLIIAVIIAIGASYLPARRASKLSVREILSYE